MKRRLDPLQACILARKHRCAQVDGILCDPEHCEELKKTEREMKERVRAERSRK